MENVSTLNTVSAMQNPYDLGSMSREEVIQLFEKLGVFQAALTMLSYMYNAQSALSISMYADMNEASKASTTAQKMANLVDAKIADVQSSSDKNAKARLPQEVIDYINDPRNGITISGLSEKKLTDDQIKEKMQEYMKTHSFAELSKMPDFSAQRIQTSLTDEMGAGDLQTVKAAISAKANNLTTTVNNSQLSIQQMSNTLNLLTSARSDMQSLQYRTISAISFGK
ncbi:translocator EspA [Salmonella enterica]|nr:translocator EspA [Salmonella enterica]ECJ5919872.1 translocator EspA [Salmonella enterica subsp. salamae]HCM1830797.1 translocator EspA [Salmonella enterica subsp. salamae serovar 48:z81:z39]HCM1883614.1 translocator EspA [Salmonella enterica subsp. salamae serovar 60:z10:z39]EAN4946768.1 translocator EspA [Salmonella enterica]